MAVLRDMEGEEIKYTFCNEYPEATTEQIYKPELMRWSIEQRFMKCKTYLRMDH
jgi:hypothetical protein